MAMESISSVDARRLALSAQGFALPRPSGEIGLAQIRSTIQRLCLLQIDYVNVLTPAHYQVLFSRLGPYRTALLDELLFKHREFTEQWAHEASIIPVSTWPLLRHRMEAHRIRPHGIESLLERLSDYVDAVLALIEQRGPLAAADLPRPEGVSHRIESAWWTVPRAVLESYFGRGRLAIADRRANFARTYDLAERLLPAECLSRRIDADDARRELLLRAARACGIATASDLADYFRMSRTEARPRLAELVDAGELQLVRVEGWREPAYLDPTAPMPNRIDARALLSPFDPVVWYRPRASRLFDFDHRFEIFVPAAKRRWGTYVLPFLSGDRLVARVDLKAERTTRTLRVLAAFCEPALDANEVAVPLADELQSLATWLSLDKIAVATRGNLARTLRKATRR